MVTDAWEVFHSAAPYENDGVLLKIMTDSWDVSRYLNPIGKSYSSHLSKGRVRLFGCGSVYFGAHSSFLRTALEPRALRLRHDLLSSLPY